MEWLGQNWLWVVLAAGAFFFFMTRRGGFGMDRSRGHRHDDQDRHEVAPPSAGNRPGNLFDPVSAHAFVAGGAPISAVYGGRAYYFENRENRDTFETDPQKYVAGSPDAGAPIASGREGQPQRHHQHGC